MSQYLGLLEKSFQPAWNFFMPEFTLAHRLKECVVSHKSMTTVACDCTERTSSGPPWHGPRAPQPPWRCIRQPYRPWPWPHHKSAQPSRWPRCGWCKSRTRNEASLETTRYVLRDLLSLVGSLVDSLVSVVGSLVGGLVGVVGSLIGVVLSLLHVRHGRDGVEEKC